MTVEQSTSRSQLVDMRGMNIVDAETIQLGPQVVDAQQKHIPFFLRCRVGMGTRQTDKAVKKKRENDEAIHNRFVH